MTLGKLLSGQKTDITRKWLDALVDSYPSDTRRFLRKEKSRFANPVGQTYKDEVERLFEAFVNDQTETMTSALDGILRVRAIQDFTPSGALGFLFQFRQIIREALQGKGLGNGTSGAVKEADEKLDQLLLTGFDIYSKRREKIYDLRVNEIKRQVARLLERANLVVEIPDTVPDLGNHNTE
ncbi:MAG: RsbRD N-terminal domain-containing protein [Deltaproteobacteria bacterium]|nr:RsbRD N-terminal domain-containing protein [Deltaproteobacteria bacterium]